MLKIIQRQCTRKYARLAMNPFVVTDHYQYYSQTHRSYRGGGGGNFLVGVVVNTKVGDLKDDVKE